MMPTQRLTSLDAFRGYTVAAMIMVNFPGSETFVYPTLHHTHWNGLDFTDQILLSPAELVAAIANPSLGVGAEVPLRVHARMVAPLLDMALAMMGIPLVVGPNRRGIFVAVGLCVSSAVVFFLMIFGWHALAAAYVVSPSIGAWAPLLILAPLASWTAQPMWQ